jgi:hypothetical protein
LWLCYRQPEEVRGRDDYTLKNISRVVEFSLSLPETNAAVERVFSLVNALWTDERNRLRSAHCEINSFSEASLS